MHPSSKAAGSFIEGMVGALTVLAVFALIGVIALLAAAGTALYFFVIWSYPHVQQLADLFAIWLVDKL